MTAVLCASDFLRAPLLATARADMQRLPGQLPTLAGSRRRPLAGILATGTRADLC